MRLRFWPSRDQRIAELRTKLRATRQLAARLRLGNAKLARENRVLVHSMARGERTITDATRALNEAATEISHLGEELAAAWTALDAIGVARPVREAGER